MFLTFTVLYRCQLPTFYAPLYKRDDVERFRAVWTLVLLSHSSVKINVDEVVAWKVHRVLLIHFELTYNALFTFAAGIKTDVIYQFKEHRVCEHLENGQLYKIEHILLSICC